MKNQNEKVQKTQIKPRKDKKKNTETGLLMGQNTNIFSQLSATYLTSKANVTQQQEHFVKQTQIVEYHDQNINRLISLLRKKAQVTKVKAALQLREQIAKMTEGQMCEFISTYSSLYQQIVLNQQSKQVYEQFIDITCTIFQNHKKVALRQIQTLFPSMLISIKLNKLTKLLFTGSQEQVNEKAFLLFIKKQVKKKFLLISKIILQSEQLQLLSQTNYQRNLLSYVKAVKQMGNIFMNHSKKADLQNETQTLIQQLSEFAFGKGIDQYTKLGGRGKASLMELYTYFVQLYSLLKWDLPWKKFTKIVSQNYLDKDPVVQYTLWKYCNKDLIISLKKIAKIQQKGDIQSLLYQFLPKYDQKLIECLNIGGLAMYKNLAGYVKQFPLFQFSQLDTHKSIIQKMTFARKFIQQILSQEDQNQSRIECYFNVCLTLIKQINYFQQNYLSKIIQTEGQKLGEGKKQKQIKNLFQKFILETIGNLQKKFYNEPPTSKNSFTFYIPDYFAKLLSNHKTVFTPTFNQKLIFQLYKSIDLESEILETIYEKCESNLSLLLSFYENWTATDKQVNLDMSQTNQQYEKTAKIFLLANKKRSHVENYWFQSDWDLRKSAIIFDPRLTSKDLQAETQPTQGQVDLQFSPITKSIIPIYQFPELNTERFNFFLRILQNEDIQSQNLRFFLPYFYSYLLTEENIKVLLNKYIQKSMLLKDSKWTVGQRQVTFLRINVEAFNKYLLKNEGKVEQNLKDKFKLYFFTIGQFLRNLNAYKMDKQVQQILKSLNQLLRVPQYQQQLFLSITTTFQDIFSQINISLTKSNQEKMRKNRLKRLTEFVEKVVWYLIKRNSNKQNTLILNMFKQQSLWIDAQNKIEPWAIGFTILNNCQEETLSVIASEIINNFDKYLNVISLLLSCQMLLALQVYPNLKKTYVTIQNALHKKIASIQVQAQLTYIQMIVFYQYQRGLLTESLGLKNLVKNVFKFYHTFSQDQLQAVTRNIIQPLIKKLIGQQKQNEFNLSTKSMIVYNALSELPIQDLTYIDSIYQQVVSLLQSSVKHLQSHLQRFLSLCLISNIFWKTARGRQTLIHWQQSKLIESLMNKLVPSLIQKQSTYHSFVIFLTMNSLYAVFGIEIFDSNKQIVMKYFWNQQQNQRSHPIYIFKQEERIRFINRIFLDLKPTQTEDIVNLIPRQALHEYNHYEKVLIELEDQQQEDQALSTQKPIHNLFIQYSQLLIKMTTYFSQGQNKKVPDETTIVELLQCPFAGVKKVCFILLKQLYDFKLVKPEIPNVYCDILIYKLKSTDNIEEIKVANEVYNFLYNWLALISRRKVTEIVKQDEQAYTLEDYIQNEGLSEVFLNNLFNLLADKIDYLKNEEEYNLASEQLIIDDFNFNVEDQQNILQKMFFLSCKLLFHYSINFPLYLRTFMDKSKKYRSVCQKLLRNIISDAVFSQQVTMIEIREPQWKASGNLQIYVVKKNKQIYAEYQHDVIRIGLRLVMRPNYPLTPIHIEFGQGLKMEDGSKWALMLQSQLHNRNNSIINGILLWKDNIDKKLSGVEECTICFDIVNPNGHLPKKACKTCKKKFHGNCIMKWFSKSNKSQCPLCKSQFL